MTMAGAVDGATLSRGLFPRAAPSPSLMPSVWAAPPSAAPAVVVAAPPVGLWAWLVASVYGSDCCRSQCERACFCQSDSGGVDSAKIMRDSRIAKARAREAVAAEGGGETSAAAPEDGDKEAADPAALAQAEAQADCLVQSSLAAAASSA